MESKPSVLALALLALSSVAYAQEQIIQVSYLVAFLGGVVSLLSPCSAAVLPAFFAYSFREKRQLLKKSLVFFAGLSIPLILLGLSASVAGMFLNIYRGYFVVASGILIIIFGIMSLFGKGFSLPLTKRLASRGGKRGVFAFGFLFGIGFVPCAGPILGSILTLAAASPSALHGVLLLEVYAAGVMVPVFLLSYFFDKRKIAVFSKTLRIAGREFPWTNIFSGALFISLGLLFIFFGGSTFLNAIFSDTRLTETFFRLNDFVQAVFSSVPDYLFLAIAALLAAVLLYAKKRKTGK